MKFKRDLFPSKEAKSSFFSFSFFSYFPTMPLSELYRVARGKLDSTQDKNSMVASDLSMK